MSESEKEFVSQWCGEKRINTPYMIVQYPDHNRRILVDTINVIFMWTTTIDHSTLGLE